jgi:hypothetical protein
VKWSYDLRTGMNARQVVFESLAAVYLSATDYFTNHLDTGN